MNILFACSEATPFAKTGGLADVCGALPKAVRELGHDVSLFLPAYTCVSEYGGTIELTDITFDIPVGGKIVSGRLMKAVWPGTDIPVYLVKQDDYFHRDELYGPKGDAYKDNCERYVFFCRAVLESILKLNMNVDVVHCHDWQTGLIPAYLKIEYPETPGYENISSVLTIHNLQYQGVFWHWDMLLTGLDWKYFNWREMEYHGQLNLLKTGLIFADALTTVSPQYAVEIQGYESGCGLDGVLQDRSDALQGILNGVDYDEWNPDTDSHIPVNYTVKNWREGRTASKKALQQELKLPVNPNVPLIGLVGRLAEQKGWDLVLDVMQRWARDGDAQWAILGSGDPHFEEQLNRIAAACPDRVGVSMKFSEPLARRIYAGSDLFAMPSRFEPCGLSQLYSLKYGTVPVVRETGGLADTIVNATETTLGDKTANGFSFKEFDADAFDHALRRACNMYQNNQETWSRLVETGMNQDWSWTRSANEYVNLYQELSQKK